MIYAGIGSRETPLNILDLMAYIALVLGDRGYLLRSGGAIGADTSFARGSDQSIYRKKEIWRPTQATKEAIDLASEFHPTWHKCDTYARQCHGRNAMILLGENLDNPAMFVVCWTKRGEAVGGTGMGIRIAMAKHIPVYNLGTQKGFMESVRLVSNPPPRRNISPLKSPEIS